jgi:hypothetical protein
MRNTSGASDTDADRTAGKTGRADGAANASNVRERMEVVASCGTKVGVVDHVQGSVIKLTRKDSSDGEHHFLPASMIDRVDDRVHLNRNADQARREWKADAASCGS